MPVQGADIEPRYEGSSHDGDGAVQTALLADDTPYLPTTKTVLGPNGTRQPYIVPRDGSLIVKLWGGGGGGAALPASGSGIQNEPGACGGFTTLTVPVTAGQLVEFEVAGGGQGGQWSAGQLTMTGGAGGNGGYPDGGKGGFNTAAISGGGGGSTRLWIDGVLVAVAAGGGGCGVTQADRRPGAGGGLVGQDAICTLNGYQNGKGTGGTQTAGGINVAWSGTPSMQGGYLRGGNGFATANGQTVSSASSGGGGGGGYYGGGGGGGSNTNAQTGANGGGGGSSFIQSGTPGSTESGNYYIAPGGAGDADYGAGAGVGGTSSASTTVIANAGNGGAGRAVALLVSVEDLTPTTATTVAASGIPREYVATQTGALEVKLWGAGGGGGIASNNFTDTRNGGAGGYTTVVIPVVVGDVIKVEVGVGGRRANALGNAGLGGWPDGGWGGALNEYAYAGGGGGGSTRVYKNNVLQAVAGAGGGGCGNAGGPGGGLAGATYGGGNGGTQTAGGANTINGAYSGTSLKGGNSYNRTVTGPGSQYEGGGGGGGYYGGSAYTGPIRSFGGGGGGSGFVRAGLTGSTSAGTTIAPIGSIPPVTTGAPAGTSIGGLTGRSVAANNTNGGDGFASITYFDELNLNTPKTSAYSGSATLYLVKASGRLNVKLWAAGGGAGTMQASIANARAGSGGQVTGSLIVEAGDIVTVEIGGGGKYSNVALGRGGLGGWPDGGDGGFSASDPGACFGGGGGSSRLYVNGVLKMVAGSGGGNGWGQVSAGEGGGLTGGTFSGNAISGLGGTQSAGGATAGAYLNGGDASATRTLTGGGGGGGYYGGGSSRGLFGAGGGGSSWTASDVSDVVHAQGVAGVAPSDVDRPAGVAEGGLGYAYNGSSVPTDGGNGAGLLSIVPITLGANAPSTASYVGKAIEYTVTAAGSLRVDAWGGGGAGSTDGSNRGCYGGAGGYTWFDIDVFVGDKVKVEVGQGGRKPAAVGVTTPGAWPDGGEGSFWTGNASYTTGTGGGSTRIYINNVLKGVAGAGGAGTIGSSGNGGNGGGTEGGNGNGATGGTQIAGGTTSGPARISSAQFRGASSPNGSNAGGAGGGGWYGGGAGATEGAWVQGAGGSGYLAPGTPGATERAAAVAVTVRPVPTGTRPSSTVGQGGFSGRTFASGLVENGGDGAVTLLISPPAPPIDIAVGGIQTAPSSLFKSQQYQITQDGALDVKAWGGGGGGGITLSSFVTANDRAGGGGFTKGYIPVSAGDIITVEVGRGGKRGPNVTTGGLGGWPDGGNGSTTTYNSNYSPGGGGGSSRIYKNGVLVMVAGAGGGGGRGFSGGGGGMTGGAAGPGHNTAAAATGGTQIAGGINGGAYLKGADGAGAPDFNAGGGGGYYGGGAVQGGNPSLNSGGGGSGYIAPSVVGGSTVAAISSYDGSAAVTTDPHYVAGVGRGGVTNRGTDGSNTDGGNGLVRLELKPSSVLADLYTPVPYSGSDVNLTVTTAGFLTVKLWGGGGGGSVGSDQMVAGGGGYTTVKLIVQVGDVVKFQTGQGGRRAISDVSAAAAWPDGGRPGRTSNTAVGFGSGGGSSRVWLNGDLMAVAGAGGASGASNANGRAGAGGGTSGQDGGSTLGYGRGGTQTAGGANFSSPANTFYAGAYLQGGLGTNVDDSTVATFWSGGGGGGGYYGGAGGGYYGGTAGTIYYGGGGGGSGYLNTSHSRYVEGSTTAGNLGVGANKTEEQYPGGVGDGGIGTGVFGTHADGQNGYIAYKSQGALIAELSGTINLTAPTGGPDDPVLRGYRASGQPVLYTVTTAGNLIAGLWGAGGAGGFRATNVVHNRGGGAGFTYIEYPVLVGDIVKLEVGVGGGSALPSGGGLGGWPDGGDGGLFTANGATGTGGGGGGSTRLWVNSTLVAVAAAGGGGFSGLNDGTTLPDNYGGHGGGLTGGVGTGTNATTIQGATQTAGGINPVRPAQNGATLSGGDARGATVSTSTVEAGGGGGGGYYGGAGGGSRTNTSSSYTGAGGSGGSSFIHPTAHYGFTLSGSGREPGGLDHPLRLPNTGRGSLGSTLAEGGSLAGEDGYGVFGVSTASTGIANGEIFDNSIVFTNEITVDTIGEGPIGTLVWFAELGGTGTLEAVINVPFVDYELEFSPEQATVSAAVAVNRPLPGPLALGAAMGSGSSAYTATADLEPLVLTVERVTGYAEDGVIVTPVDTLPEITLYAPDGMAGQVGSAGYATGLLDVTVTLGDLNAPVAAVANAHTLDPLRTPISIVMTPPVGKPSTPDMETDGLPFENELVFTQAPDAIAEDGVVAPADLTGFIYTTIEADAGAVFDAKAEGYAQAYGENGFEGYVWLEGNPIWTTAIDLITLGAPSGAPSAGATMDFTDVVRIILRAPAVTAKQAADILGSIIPAMINLSSPRGIGGPPNFALAVGDLDNAVLTLSEPHAYADDSAKGKIHLLRTNVPGRAPVTLGAREIAINEADGIIYSRDATGKVWPTPIYAIQTGGEMPGGGAIGQFLRGDGTWGAILPNFDTAIRVPTPITRVILAEKNQQPIAASIGAGEVRYQPFFISHRTVLSQIGVGVSILGDAVLQMGVCTWVDGAPGVLLAAGMASTNTTGLKAIPGTLALEPGWYAAVVSLNGAGAPVFAAAKVSKTLMPDFTLAGDLVAQGDLVNLPVPTQRAADAVALLSGQVLA